MAAGIGGAISGFKKIKEGKAMAKAGQEGVDGFEWEDLTNPFDNLQVSTEGSDLRTDQANIASATVTQAARAGGVRSIIGSAGRIQAQNTDVSREVAANLDEQQKAIDAKRAQDETVIRGMTERRQADELAGYGNMIDVGNDLKYQGIGDLVAVGGAIDDLGVKLLTGGMGGAMGGAGSGAVGAVATNGGNMLG